MENNEIMDENISEHTEVGASNDEAMRVEEQAGATSEPTDGTNWEELYKRAAAKASDLQNALREERAEKRNLKARMEQPKEPQSEDESFKRFIQTEANATIAIKLQTDPSFKDRVEIVQEYVAQGYDINMADKLAKADIMDRILKETSAPVQTSNIPKQIQPTATQEQVQPRLTGNSLDDIQKGLKPIDLPNAEALIAMLKKERPRR